MRTPKSKPVDLLAFKQIQTAVENRLGRRQAEHRVRGVLQQMTPAVSVPGRRLFHPSVVDAVVEVLAARDAKLTNP